MIDHEYLRTQFLLDPGITYLNFGSFGACPQPVFADYQKWQLLLEREPVRFIAHDGATYLRNSRQSLATYLNCSVDDIVYVTNPTYAINIVAKNLDLKEGDEILSTDIEYGALDRTWNYYCRKAKAKYIRQPITIPVASKEDIIAQFWEGYNSRTKAIFISQITSSTSLRLPVEEICAMAKQKGLLTIVDGAHVPGHISLDLSTLQADIYTGACHKWMMAPKGCSFLYVKSGLQHLFDPLIISWGYESAAPSHSQFLDYHQMQGTRDFSAFLTVPKAIEFMHTHKWEEVAAHCRGLARDNYKRFCDLLGSQPIRPDNEDFHLQICSVPINTTRPEELNQLLFDKYRIEVPVMRQDGKVFLRYSVNAFNDQQQLDTLYDALQDVIRSTDLIRPEF
jgi:isopenicillin-N epimerase